MPLRKSRTLLLISAALAVPLLLQAQQTPRADRASTHGIRVADIEPAIAPGDDFFH